MCGVLVDRAPGRQSDPAAKRDLGRHLPLVSGEPRTHLWSLEAPMQCKEVMTRHVDCVSPMDTVQAAARRMRDDDIGFLPVCDTSKKVVGAITDRDLAVRVIADGLSTDTAVGQIMTREVIACRADDDLSQAEQLMAEHQKSRIMCLDDGGQPVGVISLADIAHSEHPDSVTETLRQMKSVA